MADSITFGKLLEKDPQLAERLKKALRSMQANGVAGDADLTNDTVIDKTYLEKKLADAASVRNQPKTAAQEASWKRFIQNVEDVARRTKNLDKNEAQQFPLAQLKTIEEQGKVQKLIDTRETDLDTLAGDLKKKEAQLDDLKQKRDEAYDKTTKSLYQPGESGNTDPLKALVDIFVSALETVRHNNKSWRDRVDIDNQYDQKIWGLEDELDSDYTRYDTTSKELIKLDKRLAMLNKQAADEQNKADAAKKKEAEGATAGVGVSPDAPEVNPSATPGIQASGDSNAPVNPNTNVPRPGIGGAADGEIDAADLAEAAVQHAAEAAETARVAAEVAEAAQDAAKAPQTPDQLAASTTEAAIRAAEAAEAAKLAAEAAQTAHERAAEAAIANPTAEAVQRATDTTVAAERAAKTEEDAQFTAELAAALAQEAHRIAAEAATRPAKKEGDDFKFGEDAIKAFEGQPDEEKNVSVHLGAGGERAPSNSSSLADSLRPSSSVRSSDDEGPEATVASAIQPTSSAPASPRPGARPSPDALVGASGEAYTNMPEFPLSIAVPPAPELTAEQKDEEKVRQIVGMGGLN